MVFKEEDNLQKIRYEIIRERIMRNRIINKAMFGVIDIAIGAAIILFDINFVGFIFKFSQYIAPNWELAAITAGAIWIIFIIGIVLIGVGAEVFTKGVKLEEKYKKDYGIEVF